MESGAGEDAVTIERSTVCIPSGPSPGKTA
jgi:hypothetical protein